MVQMERKANEVREVFQFIICLSTAAHVFVSTGRAIDSSCSESTIKVKKSFFRSSRGCTRMLRIQEEFANSGYPTASDALQLVLSAFYPTFPIHDPFVSY